MLDDRWGRLQATTNSAGCQGGGGRRVQESARRRAKVVRYGLLQPTRSESNFRLSAPAAPPTALEASVKATNPPRTVERWLSPLGPHPVDGLEVTPEERYRRSRDPDGPAALARWM